jgi:quinol monooxygenase YgiN
MAVVLIAWAPSREAYEAVDTEVGRTAPPGCIVHTASEVNGRVRVVDVWESQQHIDEFFQSKLGPVFEKLGVERGIHQS